MGKIIRHPSFDNSARPFMIIWEVTQACDLACLHCRAEAISEHRPGTLTLDEGKVLLEGITSFGKPSPIVILTGGDPFKRADLFQLIEHGSSQGLVMAISPSGTPLLNPENLSKVKSSGAKVISLSIDGATPSRHDSFRGIPGSLERTLRGWRAATEAGLKVQVNTTVSRHNLHDLPNILSLILHQRVMTWSLFFLVPVGRAKSSDEISPEEYEAVMHFLYDCSKYISVKTTEGHHYKRVAVQRSVLDREGTPLSEVYPIHPLYTALSESLQQIVDENEIPKREKMRRSPMHINAANGFVFISYDGEVYPSGFLPLRAGNVREQTLQEIYCSSPLFKSLRDPRNLKGRCGKCEFAGICGGSRSRAYAMTGDPFAEEPFCTYQPGSFGHSAEMTDILPLSA